MCRVSPYHKIEIFLSYLRDDRIYENATIGREIFMRQLEMRKYRDRIGPIMLLADSQHMEKDKEAFAT